MAYVIAPVDGTLIDVDWAIDITDQVNSNTDALSLSTPGAQLRRAAAFSLSNAAVVAIDLDTDDIDTQDGHSTSVNPSRYVIPTAAIYMCVGGVGFAANATGIRTAQLLKNGGAVASTQTKVNAVGGGVVTAIPSRPILLSLSPGDYIEIAAFQNSGGSLNTTTETEGMPTLTISLAIRT